MYNNGNVYVKALRIPKSVKLNFKNDDLYASKKSTAKKEIQSTVKENKNLMFMEDDNTNNTKEEKKEKPKEEETKKENPKPQQTIPPKEEKPNLGFVIPDNINFSNIADNLKDSSKNETKQKAQTSKTPIPQNKKAETNFSDLNGIFNNIGSKDSSRPGSPSQKPKIDSTCKILFYNDIYSKWCLF